MDGAWRTKEEVFNPNHSSHSSTLSTVLSVELTVTILVALDGMFPKSSCECVAQWNCFGSEGCWDKPEMWLVELILSEASNYTKGVWDDHFSHGLMTSCFAVVLKEVFFWYGFVFNSRKIMNRIDKARCLSTGWWRSRISSSSGFLAVSHFQIHLGYYPKKKKSKQKWDGE